jgi:hypothetical protein
MEGIGYVKNEQQQLEEPQPQPQRGQQPQKHQGAPKKERIIVTTIQWDAVMVLNVKETLS